MKTCLLCNGESITVPDPSLKDKLCAKHLADVTEFLACKLAEEIVR